MERREFITIEEGLRNYLVLLSLCETCKYKNIDFLDFLRSGSKDIDDFADSRWKQRLRGAHYLEWDRAHSINHLHGPRLDTERHVARDMLSRRVRDR